MTPFTSMGIENLTVAVTTFHRHNRLRKALDSVWNAGIKRVTVSAPACDDLTKETLAACREHEWLSFDVGTTEEDIGVNNSWMLAAYLSRTKRLILLHDDDSLSPDFGTAYQNVIGPCLDKRDAGFASWDAESLFDDGRTEPCPYWQGSTNLVIPSKQFEKNILAAGNLTHSPACSVFNRTILIRACKEAGERLISNNSLERPGMLLGTELVVYLRHCQSFKRWLHLPKVLAYYGNHEGSGTVKAQAQGYVEKLIKGYDLARNYSRLPPPIPTPRLLLVHSVYTPKDEADRKKQATAQESWQFHFSSGEMIDLPYHAPKMPKIREVLDYACQFALPEDIIVYANADAGLTTHATERILEGIAKGRGVTSCGHRVMETDPCRLYKNLTNQRAPGGTEVIAMTPAWWGAHRDKMPDMFIGREGWDTCFNALAEDWADGPGDVISDPDLWLTSRAHTDNVCWHQDHFSQWQKDRTGISSESQRHNRELAREFFQKRGDSNMVEMLK